MGKKAKIEENFLTSSIFTFESYKCTCEETSVSTNISMLPVPAVKLTPDTRMKVYFAFGSKVGLVRLNEDGSIAESNILGKLVAINRNDIRAYFSFFENNGFFFPIATDKSEIIGLNELQFLVGRLQATLELMSTITDMSRTSYERIIRMIFYHLFAPVVSVETKDGKYKYVSDIHQYSKYLETNKDADRAPRLNDTFNNENFSFNDNIAAFSMNADFVDSVLNGTPADSKYQTPLFQNVFTAYCAPRDGKPKTMLFINDFVFHYFYEVGIIDYVDLEKTHYINDEVHKENFTEQLKSAAVRTAKFIIKEEIESNLRRVRPTYNTAILEPAWKIDSLLSALYFGLFYMRPNMETYRRCANPKCGEFFPVPVSSRKKKYCCTACMNRAMAARKRARDKLSETKYE
ncbi:BRcat domain-containing protein [Chordicoccus furentiruminis]|uniref:BRcat domain-containing protein n=1 Tax=Chordicoccus furentiruminis TaxID=2709410 RepID=UPI0023A8D88E|nr:hypothetical protein [Chordicoccus furentiruminis]